MAEHQLKIGDLKVRVPVIQGGMGIGVSLSGLASAVANAGGIGIISTAQIGFRDPEYDKNPLACNLKAVKEEIQRARQLAPGGIIGVNIMYAARGYEEYVKAAVNAGVDCIISGAGLPMELPALTAGSGVRIAPIVSSKRALHVLMKRWQKNYDRIPDFIVVEGPRAELEKGNFEQFDNELKAVLSYIKDTGYEIPVIAAGGIYTRDDLLHYLELGAAGIQMSTRFVTTYECDAHNAYKQCYIDARKEDIILTDSPVGMPGRAIRNQFLERVKTGERMVGKCRQCIKQCRPDQIPYCITQALINAVEGRVQDGLIFCGENAYRADRMEHVADIMKEFAL